MKMVSIDIGTNSVLLLVADKVKGHFSILEEKQEIPRLGKGVDQDKNLHPDSRKRVLDVLLSYKKWLQEYYPNLVPYVQVTATSAVRDASNRDLFISEIKKSTGWDVQLLSGDEEAEITYKGALSVLPDSGLIHNLVLDIGGGSTEIAKGKGLKYESGFSFDMGSVRYSERFFSSDPPGIDELEQARDSIRKMLLKGKKPSGDFRTIGVAGTVTSLAGIAQGLDEYEHNRINEFRLSKQTIENFIEEFSGLSSCETEEKYPVFLKGRGDVILAGTLILDEFLNWCGKNEIIVSTGGIRHGILFR